MNKKIMLFLATCIILGCFVGCKKNDDNKVKSVQSSIDSSTYIDKSSEAESSKENSSADEKVSFKTCETSLDIDEIKDAKITQEQAEIFAQKAYKLYINKDANTTEKAKFSAESAAKFDNTYYYMVRGYEGNNDTQATFGWYFVNANTGEVYDAGPSQSELLFIPKR